MTLLVFSFVAGAALIVFFYGVGIYNALVRVKNNVRQAWSNIDVILKQRHDELPKLIETCKQYMKYEAETLEKVMRARAAVSQAQSTGNVGALGTAEGQLRGVLGGLFAVAENYPDLKANASFQSLHARISQLENTISDRRELYNQAVTINNTRLEQFPDNLIAGLGSFEKFEVLKFDATETADVSVGALFNR
ncbi:MAG: LemA family protein [Elusimicrobia bacterium]|jgi:LemA protein|nr:LemA family protein [Elusimicrobiota bacterium]MBK7207000.1 LemA family protein [Elusimicrobiota bacterium]MBK7545820.1 LemA family protein [Elusimicrobiota bacterium]MBK7575084.1 LemA family protein [Elusimicrobiota bacterium]MBK7687650.1 LemA family protein [Elusimicrobiota bacterium]